MQKTAYEMRISDWSSDVCSSDLPKRHRKQPTPPFHLPPGQFILRISRIKRIINLFYSLPCFQKTDNFFSARSRPLQSQVQRTKPPYQQSRIHWRSHRLQHHLPPFKEPTDKLPLTNI